MPLLKNKRRVLFISFLLVFTVVSAQKRERYEFYKDFPVYADKLLAQLTYPLAWGNSDIKDFSEWKDTARKKVLECMMTPPRRRRVTT